MTMTEARKLEFVICRKASDVPDFALTTLRQHEVDANVILPTFNKCRKHEQKGMVAQDHIWIIAFVRTPSSNAVKLIFAVTNGLTGKYPLFLFTPISNTSMKEDPYIYRALTSGARYLQELVPTERIYSVFGREMLSRTFATIWTEQTKIPFITEPYYHCKITYLTPNSLELSRRALPLLPNFEMRPAEMSDLEGVAELCYGFADACPPFTMSKEGALAEAEQIIRQNIGWVLTSESHEVVSLVAFTRNSEKVATITKVFTSPEHRGANYGERLVRAVCEYLLYDCVMEKVCLFVGTENPAANVYQRVGFVGVGKAAANAPGVDTWCEIGFDRSMVQLGHW